MTDARNLERSIDDAQHLDSLLAALADPVRRFLLEMASDDGAPAGSLAASATARFGISTSRASQHLQVLAQAGLVEVNAEGTVRWYRVRLGSATPVAAWLDGMRLSL